MEPDQPLSSNSVSEATPVQSAPTPKLSETVRFSSKVLKDKASQLVADDRLTDVEIAAELGISDRTLRRWKSDPRFSTKVQEILSRYEARAMQHGLARREKRLTILNDLHNKILDVIEERSQDSELAGVPGGTTGIVTKMLKGIGRGDDYQVVEVYEVDTGLLKEIRAIHEQVAEELGQKVKKHEHSGPGGGPVAVDLIGAKAKLLAALEGGTT